MKILISLFVLLVSTQIFAKTSKIKTYDVVVTEKGYEPSTLQVKANEPFKLKLKRTTNSTCAREIVVPKSNINVKLPLDKEVIVDMPALEKGEIKFGCAMDLMIGGVIHVQ